MAKQTTNKASKSKELNILENPATNTDGGFEVLLTNKDIENFPKLQDAGILGGDKIIISNEESFIVEEPMNANSKNQNTNPIITDDLTLLKFYSEELLVSLGDIYIGGRAAQKRDQLFEFLQKLK